MTGTFDLARDRWLPVTLTDGTVADVGLAEAFLRAHEIADLAGLNPPARAGLYRVLTALTYRITGLDDTSDSDDPWPRERVAALAKGHFDPAAVEAYFERWAHRFDLFDPDRPFLQDPALAAECPAGPCGLTTILWERPGGQNAHTLFSPYHEANPGTATILEAVEALLAATYYGPSGRCQTRAHGGGKGSANFTYIGPLRSRVSYHPVGSTLFVTLLAHLVAPNTVDLPNPNRVADLPEWEWESLPPTSGAKPRPVGPVSLLTGNNGHAMLLVPSQGGGGVSDGYFSWRYALKDDAQPVGFDPYLSYRNEKGKVISRQADAGREAWRDVAGILAAVTATPDPVTYQPPQVTTAMTTLPLPTLATIRMAALGYVQHGFQPVNEDWYASIAPARILTALSDHADPDAVAYRTAVPEWVSVADAEAQTLSGALHRAYTQGHNVDPTSDRAQAWSSAATTRFWVAAHRAFRDAFAAHPGGQAFADAIPATKPALRRIVIDLYRDQTSSVRDGRAMAAVAKNQPRHVADPPTGNEAP